MSEDMGLSGITVRHERVAGREPNEGYITRQPTWDRWLALENYLALSASAEGYASFFDDFALGYDLQPNGTYTRGGGGVMGGAMAGTWSIAIEDQIRGFSLVMISNNHGDFDEAITRLEHITYGASPCLFGPEDPRSHLERMHFIRNVAEPTRYVNIENGLAASPALPGWWSAQWLLEPTDSSYFRIKNRWTDEYLHIEGGITRAADRNTQHVEDCRVKGSGRFQVADDQLDVVDQPAAVQFHRLHAFPL